MVDFKQKDLVLDEQIFSIYLVSGHKVIILWSST